MANKGINVFSLYVDKEFADEIKERAKREKLSASAWIRQSLAEKLRREKEESLRRSC